MKHIRPYKILESTIGDSIETLKDIALEITDEDQKYVVDVMLSKPYRELSKNMDEILVRILHREPLVVKKIHDVLQRMINYMESEGYDYIINLDHSVYRKFTLEEVMNRSMPIHTLDIRFSYGWRSGFKKFKKKK